MYHLLYSWITKSATRYRAQAVLFIDLYTLIEQSVVFYANVFQD